MKLFNRPIMVLLIIFAILVNGFISCSSSDDDDDDSSGGGNGGDDTPPVVVGEECPTFSPIGGFYKEKQSVTISCPGAKKIYYTILTPTLDKSGEWDEEAWKTAVGASKPTENSTEYTDAFEIDGQCIIRAVAIKNDDTKRYAMTAFDFDLDRATDFKGSQTPTLVAENAASGAWSSNWQDQSIYFILTDRFFNGDTTNDRIEGLKNQAGADYNETLPLTDQTTGYNGGDIEGIRKKLDYIKNLGFTAIWMTPPIKCQVQDQIANCHGYHGYWASDFTKVDSHMGTLAQYQAFVTEAHQKGLYVIQDIVVNHVGDYQQINKAVTNAMMKRVDKGTPIAETVFSLGRGSIPFNHPEQLPWALNNINDLTQDEWKNNAFYHYNPLITDYTNAASKLIEQSSNLDDMRTEYPVVRNLLRGYFRYWIDKAGIDGYRIDTALYVEPEFFEGFINSTESGNEGVRVYGKSKGKEDFITFGETFDNKEETVGSYTGGKSGPDRMDSILYFPLYNSLIKAIGGGQGSSIITEVFKNRYDSTKGYYKHPNRLVTFIDNHDVDRWGKLTKGNTSLTKAAYDIIYTIPGIPQVYYGSEQGFDDEMREGMFQGSFKTKDPRTTQTADKFDETSDWYKYFQKLNKMRRENRVFRYNKLDVLCDTKEDPGIFSYLVRETENDVLKTGENAKSAIFIMNTASTDKVLSVTNENLNAGDKYTLIDTLNTSAYNGVSSCPDEKSLIEEFVVGSEKSIKLLCPKSSCAIYIITQKGSTSSAPACTLTLDDWPKEAIKIETSTESATATIKGTSSVAGKVKVVLNGDYDFAEKIDAVAGTQFTKTINLDTSSSGELSVLLIQEVEGQEYYSDEKKFTLDRPFFLIQKTTDPTGDDNGVGAAKDKLIIPTDPPFAGALDIEGVNVYRSGNDILLGIKMGGISHGWDPSGAKFDHVAFHLFVSDGDDTTGCTVQPKGNYTLPSAFGKWDFMFEVYGWGQGYYSSEGADADTFGKATTPTPVNNPPVDWTKITEHPTITAYSKLDWTKDTQNIGDKFVEIPGMIYFKITSSAMGHARNIAGYKFYINTWDFDMGQYRKIQANEPTQWDFGTEIDVKDTPKVCDETDNIITIE